MIHCNPPGVTVAQSERLPEDKVVSADEDNKNFSLNECSHMCTLLNDLHLQVRI